ncbi:MAG: glycosyltransferase [Chloroflexaceae bacterium]|jgi:cellulose synthase/poly-beta-1,6-N-acetylglucosamine synthase-like glycosyltransferase|nr:glycosyltransferase [Chloroflexaceae bacterium]
MALIISILTYALLAVEIGLALLVGYLLLLTIAALFARRTTATHQSGATHRFAILIPAHNEERLLPILLENLHQLDYPRSLYSIHVVADNCTDNTAAAGRAAGATMHERHDTSQIGKGYALEWLLQQIWQRNVQHDAVVILDADSVVSPNFLRVMDARMARGERAIQAYYAVRDAEQSWSVSLRSIALIVLHYLRPQGRMVLGGSAGLKGNGMVFAADIMRNYRWSGSLTEDLEYHMALILNGERVMFAPDAIVWAEMPNSLAASNSQNARWEQGRVEMVRNYVPRLLWKSVQRAKFVLFDAAMEQIIPPFSIVTIASVVCLLAALVLQAPLAVWLGVALVVGQVIYVITGLVLARAPGKVYQALLYAPIFVIWKVLLYGRVLAGGSPKGWVRTARNDVR